jgi:hypothetical protein
MELNGRRPGLSAIEEEEVDVIQLFRTYQESCRLRLDACGDDPGLRLGALQPLVNELLEQNEMLIQSISQLQEEKRMHQNMCHKTSIESRKERNGSELQQVHQVTSAASQQPDAGHVSASEVIRELNTHLTSLQIENNFLRDKNDNLEHDIENLLDMIDFERSTRIPVTIPAAAAATDSKIDSAANASARSCMDTTTATSSAPNACQSHRSCKLLTFCDSLSPEDVYGPIESLSTSPGNESQENEAQDGVVDGQGQSCASESLKSLDDGICSTGKDSGVCSDSSGTTVVIKSGGISGKSSHRKQMTSGSSCSLASTNQQLLLEEKDLLICDLQQHLESLTRAAHLSDDVIRRIEAKLSQKRAECTEWRGKAFEWQRKLNDHIKENMDLKEQILTLNDHKRCLMTRLDEQSEACQLANEELLLMRRRSSQLQQQNEFQAMTIEHLKEAIITKTRALSSISSSSSTPSLLSSSNNNRNSAIYQL